MESNLQETNTPSQLNHRPSLSAFADFVAKQEQFFEESLMSQQLRAKQIADEQEAKIKEAAKKITMGAAEVDAIRKGEDIITSEVKPEGVNYKRGSEERKPKLHTPSCQFPRSASLSRSPETEVYKKHRRYSPGDHVNKRDLGKFNSDTRYDHDKYHQRPRSGRFRCRSGDGRGGNYPGVSKSPDDGTNSRHERADSRKCIESRGASPSERSWKRERSPSKSKPQRYCHESPNSPGDRRGRNYHTVYKRPPDDGIPRDRKCFDSGKHRERRDSSPSERIRKRERIPSSKPERRSYCNEDSHSSRFGSSRYRSGDSRAKDYHRARRSPDGDSNPHHGKSIDSRKYIEKRGASPLEKSTPLSAEDQNDCHGNYHNEKRVKNRGCKQSESHFQNSGYREGWNSAENAVEGLRK